MTSASSLTPSTSRPQPLIRCQILTPASLGGLEIVALYDREDTPEDAPLVLMQHGGSSHKQGVDVNDMAAVLVGERGMRLVALDGPVHGARRHSPAEDGLATRDRFLTLWKTDDAHVSLHVDQWRRLLNAMLARYAPSRIAWVGVSMGTAYGLPLLAVEPRITRAVVGMWGACYPNSSKLAGAANAVGARTLFQQKWDDELFTREGQLALFDALGCADKRLHVYPGMHVRVQGEQLDDIARFVDGADV